jgi:prepilin peptidase CpaA
MPFPPLPELFVLTLFFGLVALAAAWDMAEFRIPNFLCLAIAALYPAYAIGSTQPVDWPMATALASLLLVIGIALFCCGIVGGGDVKLLAAVALWAGPERIVELLLLMAIAGGAIGLMMMLSRHAVAVQAMTWIGAGRLAAAIAGQKVPYGVAIAAGVYLTLGPALLAAG